MPDPTIEPSISSERLADLIRRIRAGDMTTCDTDWTTGGQPHGCSLPPNHKGEHWCTCEETHDR